MWQSLKEILDEEEKISGEKPPRIGIKLLTQAEAKRHGVQKPPSIHPSRLTVREQRIEGFNQSYGEIAQVK